VFSAVHFDLLLEALQLQGASSLALLYDLAGFFVDLLALFPSPLEYVLYELRRRLLLFFGAIYGEPGDVGRALSEDVHVAVAVIFWRLDGEVSALLRPRLSKPLYLALYGAGVSGGGFDHRRTFGQPYVVLRPSPSDTSLQLLQPFCFVASIQPLCVVLANLALQVAVSAARRRLPRADAHKSRPAAYSTQLRADTWLRRPRHESSTKTCMNINDTRRN
jgi:hypothetical protein